ncbi:MAG: hypothetical protein AAFU79_16930 [Myxococcota bacterium]
MVLLPLHWPATIQHMRVVTACLLVFGAGCSALDEFEEVFQDELVIPAAVSPSAPFSAGYGGSLSALDLSTSRGFLDAGVSPSDVDSIRIVDGLLAIDLGDPRLNDLSLYVESFALFVESNTQPRANLATVTDLPMADQVVLPVSESPELKPYATDSGMRFGADLVLRQRPPLNVRLTTTLTVRVDINLLGS